MRPSISVVTIGVRDLERSMAFYRDGLGFETDGIFGTEFEGGAVVFFNLSGGLMLALYPFTELARQADLPAASDAAGPPLMTLGHNVRTRDEVVAILEAARAAGATYVDPAKDREWGGASGHFRDLDGHLWEIVWNPDFMPGD